MEQAVLDNRKQSEGYYDVTCRLWEEDDDVMSLPHSTEMFSASCLGQCYW